jgi:light-regulated signal transduction histidine kinase (bacteriophytochrome)
MKLLYFDKLPFSNRDVILIMVLSLSIILSAITFSYIRYKQTMVDYGWLNHTNLVMREIAELKNYLYRAESSTRAYALTGNKNIKPDLKKNIDGAYSQLREVKFLTVENNTQQQICDTIKPMIQERFAKLSEIIAAKDTGSDSLVTAKVYSARETMTDLIKKINYMEEIESDLLAYRMQAAQRGMMLTPIFLIGASGLSVLFIVVSFLMLIGAYQKSISLQAELEENVKDLHRSNKELEQFAYVASHDLQEPLRKMRTFSNILQTREKANLTHEGQEMLDRIDVFGSRLQKLIEDLLTYSRMINKSYEVVQVDLNKTIAEVKMNIGDAFPGKIISITCEPLPVIAGFETQLYQLFQNLINNSIKYARIDQAAIIHIAVSTIKGSQIAHAQNADSDKIFYKINVTDNGIGFDNQYAEKIFVIFQRLHGKAEYEGTGIGLAICKRVVENHSGYITASSEPDKGTTISVFLPKLN